MALDLAATGENGGCRDVLLAVEPGLGRAAGPAEAPARSKKPAKPFGFAGYLLIATLCRLAKNLGRACEAQDAFGRCGRRP